jgi:hypothetical protein
LGSDGAHRISALTKLPFVSSIIAAVLGAAFANALTSTAAMSACQAKINGQLVKISGYRGQNLSPAKYLSFTVEELTEANGQTLATTLQSFRVINAEQTLPIEFSFDINLQRDCPKRAKISVVGNDTEGFYWKPKLFGQSALIFDGYTTINVMSPKF